MMFNKLGSFIVRRRKIVLLTFVISLVGMSALGVQSIARLQNGGYSVSSSDSMKAVEYLKNTFKLKDPAGILIVKSSAGVDDPTTASDALSLEKEIAGTPGVALTHSYWSSNKPVIWKSDDKKSGFLFVYTDLDMAKTGKLGKTLIDKYNGSYKSLNVYVGGWAPFSSSISDKISKDLAVAESISIPLTFLLLIFVFGGLISSATPLIVGASAIVGALFLTYLITLFTDVSIFALNLITGMGMGLGIDYALLIVNRFREEIHHGKSVDEAVQETVRTAGRTVFFSGVTVIITLASLMFFPLMFLRSFGYAGVVVVAMAVVAALIPLPAILAAVGTNIDKWTIRKSAVTPKAEGRWAQTARFVMRRPVAIVIISIALIGLVAAPVKNVVFGQVDSRVMPANTAVAISAHEMATSFPGQYGNPIEFIIPHGASMGKQVLEYADAVGKTKGIVYVTPSQVQGDVVRFSAVHSMAPRTPEAQALIEKIRSMPHPEGVLVGGVAADYADSQNGIKDKLPFAFTWIAIGVLILLFLFTGSVLLPIKAVLLNILSLAAMLGAMTYIFIDGHMKWLTGDFTVVGTLDTSMVILVAVVTFGLSMDYEVFLLSRIKEEHDAGHGNEESVAKGLQRSARIITAAALLLAVVFAAFMTSGVTSIKTLGFGVAFAILLDASIIRALLVPALMRLFGEWNWWAPKFLRRFSVHH